MDHPRSINFPVGPRNRLRFGNSRIRTIEDQQNRTKYGSIWLTVVKVYNEFANESSIHGIKYTVTGKTRLERIFWLLILVASVLAAVDLANKFYARHKEANMRTLVIDNQYPTYKIPLPAITLCHPNLVSRKKVNAFLASNPNLALPHGLTMEDFMTGLQQLQEVYNPTNQFSEKLENLDEILKANSITIDQLMNVTSPNCEDLLFTCRFEGKIKNCSSLMKRSLISAGFCCSFNYVPANTLSSAGIIPDDLYSYNYGERFIFSMMIKDLKISDRIATDFAGNGFKVIIHNRYAYPGTSAQEFVASTGYELIAKIYARHITSTKDVLESPLSERKCYRTLAGKVPYKLDNCLIQCRENKLRNLCGCVPFFASKILPNDTLCDLSSIPCLARFKFTVQSMNPPDCYCFPDCEEDIVSVATTSLQMNALDYNPSSFYQMAKKHPHATAIHVTFSEQTCMQQRREIVLSWINLVSSLGGVFSLFLGCSFISLFELTYFLGYLIWKSTKKQRAVNEIEFARPIRSDLYDVQPRLNQSHLASTSTRR